MPPTLGFNSAPLKAKKPSTGACQTAQNERIHCPRNANEKEKGGNQLRLWVGTLSLGFLILRFPELAKRITWVLFAQQQSCIAPISWELESEVELEPMFAQVGACGQRLSKALRRNPFFTAHRSVRTFTPSTPTHSATVRLFFCFKMVDGEHLAAFKAAGKSAWAGTGSAATSTVDKKYECGSACAGAQTLMLQPRVNVDRRSCAPLP